MSRRYDHIDLRVSSMRLVQPFYESLLPVLGFTRNDSTETWLEFEYEDGDRVTDYFAVTETQDHRPNQTRIAFWAESRSKVDELAAAVAKAGGRNIEGPCFEAEFHYALFFEDPDGNRFEICHRTRN